MKDEIIEMMGDDFSMRKILEEEGWKVYQNASEKVRAITRIVVRNDLRKMQEGFKRLNEVSSQLI